MLAAALQELIDAGLQQPKREPIFFQYPKGYALVSPTTCYNSVRVGDAYELAGTHHAQLESGARRA